MDAWALIISATIGLAGGQIGAWLQGRRDRSTQLAGQRSELQQLKLQLEDARQRGHEERAHTDTLAWSERRLANYSAASAAIDAINSDSHGLPNLRMAIAISATADRIGKAKRDLEPALNLCSIIGTQPTRRAALDLAIALDELREAVLAFDLHTHEISIDPSRGDSELWRVATIARSVRRDRTHEENDPPLVQFIPLQKAVDLTSEKFLVKSLAWQDAVRKDLGVPD